MRYSLVFFLIVFCPFFIFLKGESGETAKRVTLSGYIRDSVNGEVLIGANVYVRGLQAGTVTNAYGFYSISLQPGEYTFVFSYVGYTSQVLTQKLRENMVKDVELTPVPQELDEVTVKAEKPDANVTRTEMSTNKLEMITIRKIPALMGEVDVLKAVQLLPGVAATSEGTSNFTVRGGSYDQNLILLDEATIYNPSHLMGFFSVFNNDAIRDVKLYKGDIPAAYGGRLSSLLDVRMKEGNNRKLSGTGGIGTVSSRLTLEGPVIKNKASFIVSGRRTYLDIFTPLATDKAIRKSRLYFYDLTAKLNMTLNDRNRVFLSGYSGKDHFRNEYASMAFGNQIMTARWNHLFSQRIFTNITALYSRYDYSLGFAPTETIDFIWKYNMEDFSGKVDFTWYPDPGNTVRFGIQSTYHKLNPGSITSEGVLVTYTLPTCNSLEHAVYLSNEQSITSRLSVKYGLRYSLFQNIGKGTLYHFADDYTSTDSIVYPKGKIFNTYGGFEPRIGIKYELNNRSSVKASYSRTRQYYQMASNSTSGTPLDLWFSASPNVKPQIADQVAGGYFRDFFNHTLQTSVEIYYKHMNHAMDFCDHASLYGNRKLEGELRFGSARAYGAEFLIQKPEGRFNGWISYTYSHSEKTIRAINDGKTYLAPYDKPNTVYIVLNYDWTKRFSFGAVWVYSTGTPSTFPVGRASYGNLIYPIYSGRNTYRLPDYHRLDISFTLKGKEKPGRLWQGEWNLSLYNLYARKNAWAIQFVQDEQKPDVTYAQKIYLFSIVPSLSYNFKF